MKDFKILIYGFGNPGRQDDGLGNEFVDMFRQWVDTEGFPGFEFDSNYQLNIEDAAAIKDKDIVIFVDASTEEIEDCLFTPVNGSTDITFTTHAASPGYIVQLCRELYDKAPATYLLHIRGYEWAFMEGLTDKARKNLLKAYDLMKEKFKNPENLYKGCNKIPLQNNHIYN